MQSELRVYKKNENKKTSFKWPKDKKIAVVAVLNIEIYTKFGLSIQPHLSSKNPDVANTGWRNYGNKYGLPRLLNIFENLKIPFDACVNSDVLTEEEFVWEELKNVKVPYSITAHGINNTFVLPTDDDEKKKFDFSNNYVKETLDIIEKVTNRRPKGWLSPGFSIPSYLNEILTEQKLEYTLDSTEDEVIMTSKEGLKVIPYCLETNDVSLCVSLHQSNEQYGKALVEHILMLSEEAKDQRIVCFGIHPFIAGQPGRAYHLKKAMEEILKINNVFFTNFDEILSMQEK
jgi:allantoinase